MINYLIEAAWAVFLLYWGWNWLRVKPAVRDEPVLPRLLKYWLPLGVAVLLIEPTGLFDATPLGLRFVPLAAAPACVWIGAALTWAGVLFACAARFVLGRNWSSVVQLKQGHELIVAGPYRLVRHPIYTGLLLAFIGTALAIGEWRGVLGTLIVGLSFWFKLRLEERWMRERFGAAYLEYMRGTWALIPGVL